MQKSDDRDLIVKSILIVAVFGAVLYGFFGPACPPCPRVERERDIVPTWVEAERRIADCLVKGIDRAGKPAWFDARCSR